MNFNTTIAHSIQPCCQVPGNKVMKKRYLCTMLNTRSSVISVKTKTSSQCKGNTAAVCVDLAN